MERSGQAFRGGATVVLALASLALPACREPRDLGARVYQRRCATCHGDDGAARTRFARGRPYTNLVDGIWKHPTDPASMRRLLLEGDPASPMPAFAGKLSSEEVDAVVRHVETLANPRGTP